MKRIIPAAISVGITVLLFWQFFVKGHIPIPSNFMAAWYEPWKTEYSIAGVPTIPHKAVGDDLFRQIYPMRTLASELVRFGHMPLWNPYNGAGQPLLATLHTGISNPFSLFQIASPVSGWAWVIMMQLPLLFLATYWYLRTLHVSRFGSAVSGVVLSVSGVVTTRLIYADYVYALIGLPVLLGIVESAAHGRKQWVYVIPIVIAYILVSVQPQISVYILITYGAYAWMRIPSMRTHAVLSSMLGVGISMFQLLPTLELYTQANVTSSSSAFIFDKFLMPISHLITLFIPNYFGNSGTYNFWGRTDYVETVMSMGLSAVTLALFAWAGQNKKASDRGAIVRFYYWATGISILLTLSWWGTRMLYSIPIPVLSTSIPSRLYLLTAFYIAVLSGFGAEAWQKVEGVKRRKYVLTIVGVWSAAVIGVIVTWIVGKKGVVVCPSQITSCMHIAFRNSMFEVTVFSGAAILFVLGLVNKFFMRWKMVAGAMIMCLLIGAGVYNAWKFLPMSPREYVDASHPLLRQLSAVSPSRIVGLGSAALSTDFATQHRYMDTNYYDPLYIRRYGELMSYVNTGDPKKGLTRSDVAIVADATVSAELAFRRGRFWDMTGTSFVVVKKSDVLPDMGDIVWEDSHWVLYTRPTALPRTYLVHTVVVPTGESWELAGLFSKDMDIRNTAFIEDPRGSMSGAYDAAETAVIKTYEAGRVVVDLEAKNPAFLVLSDTYFPGWSATIDGVNAHIYRTNYAFRGVAVPKGVHTVEFRYAPDSCKVGGMLSIVSAAVWVVAAYWVMKKHQ